VKKNVLFILSIALIFTGCSSNKTFEHINRSIDSKEEFKYIYSGEVNTLNYLVSASMNEIGLAVNFVDTLIEYDKYGIVQPALATSWHSNDDNTIWTFNLRKGVKWIDVDGNEYEEVEAQDFIDSIKYILTKKNQSQTANIVYGVLKNAESYYNNEISDFKMVGIKAIDKYTIQYILKKPTPYFLSMVTYACFLPVNGHFLSKMGDEFGTDNEKLLYNGAYILDKFEPQSRRILIANKKYWDEENVHIKSIKGIYNKEASMLAPELFLRGEIDFASIPSIIIGDWLMDDEKCQLVRPTRNNFFSYFYCFNFDPQFSDEFEPDNWKVAVNNLNFRKSIFYGFDRKAAMLTQEPYVPESRLSNTIVPRNFIYFNGTDYVDLGDLKDISNRDSYDIDLAIKYKENALAELKGKVKFPVKVLLPFNSGSSEWSNRAQVMEQQLENLLGIDYIDIIIDSRPVTGFLSGTRRNGNYAILECNWGPDYADPQTYTDPFARIGSYNWLHLAEGYIESNGKSKYENMIDRAKNELLDNYSRLYLFTEAEAFLINEAFIIPFSVGGGGYVASKLNPFESQYSPFGISSARYKGQRIKDKPMNSEEYEEELLKWLLERDQILKENNL